MKKNVEAVISAIGSLQSIIVELVRFINELGGEAGADIHRLSQTEGRETLKAIARLIVEAGQRARNTFHLIVDYGLSLSDMIKAGNYDVVNSDINAQNFPIKGSGKQKVDVELWFPNKPFNNGDEVIAEFERTMPDYRFATLPELLALGAAQPELQRSFPIAAFGSIWLRADGHRRFAYLYGFDTGRHLFLDRLEDGFDDYWRFAVVRKQS